MREKGRRTWIKVYCYQTLHGSVSYQLSQAEQGVWIKLLCQAGLCGFEGLICDNDQRPYPHPFLAHEFHITEKLLESTLDKCKEEGRISEDEHGIIITNWKAYQSEYERQKPYRGTNKSGKKTYKKCPECDYKALTDEELCPKCETTGKSIKLETDYTGGRYGHLVRH